MILNLLRVEGIPPDAILESSFFQFQNYSALPSLELHLDELAQQRKTIQVQEEEAISEYYDAKQQLASLKRDFKKIIHHPSNILPFLQPGRLIRIKHNADDFGWGVLVSFQKKTQRTKTTQETFFILDMLLYCAKSKASSIDIVPKPCPVGEKGQMNIIPVVLESVDAVSKVRVYVPKDLKSSENRQSVFKTISEVKQRVGGAVPLLDPIKDMNITDDALQKLLTVRKQSSYLILLEDGCFGNKTRSKQAS